MVYVLIFGFFFGIGFYIWHGYKARKVSFQNVLSFCGHLIVEISFSKNTVRTIIDKYGQAYSNHFRAVLVGYQDLLDGRQDITREKIDAIIKRPKLKTNERATLADFFYELGRHGSNEEREKIENKKMLFDTFFSEASTSLKRDASIYLKLFIILGVGAVILCL